MTEAKQGRPKGAGYDHYLDDLADIIFASGGAKNLAVAMRELFPLTFKFEVSRAAAFKRIRMIWNKQEEKLLANAAKRASEQKSADLKRKTDQLLLQAAHDLLELSKVKEDPISSNSHLGITMFMNPATLEDYKRNPMVPLLMTFGQFQVAYKRRFIQQKLSERCEKQAC